KAPSTMVFHRRRVLMATVCLIRMRWPGCKLLSRAANSARTGRVDDCKSEPEVLARDFGSEPEALAGEEVTKFLLDRACRGPGRYGRCEPVPGSHTAALIR